MKTIATLATTALLLTGGMFTVPAHADEVTAPPSCEETAQEWQARAIAAETELAGYKVLSGRLNVLLSNEKSNVAAATETIERLSRVVNRRGDKLTKLRKQLRQERRN